ncbi:hypothetical protein DXN04_05455 [Chitinophaga silvisoli]|uniref:SH3 domain-containing protein n=2 Tax=Chitinophaga silvisoli TaxID=2291814 RepID=A0A3E1P9V6_9BACT|nr:hypothetical protein DXN04_05455 [Chitinophaga silvisoli]
MMIKIYIFAPHMKQIILTSLLLVAIVPAVAQTADRLEYPLWPLEKGTSLSVYADKAYIRSSPSVKGSIVDSLLPGSQVIVDEVITAAPLTMKGLTAAWLKTHYTTGNKEVKGYVWVGLLALNAITKDGTTFIYGLEKRTVLSETGETLTVRIKALDKDHRILDMKEWTVPGGENARSSESKLLGEMGLDSVKEIFRVNFSGDACGLPTDYYYFGWNGSQLLPLPGKTNTFDAGAFAYTETLIFPKEVGGQPGKVLKLIVTEEYGEDGETVENKTVKKEVYTWDGNKATKQ